MRKVALRFVLVLVGLTSAFVMGEVGLRLLSISYPMFWQYDSETGITLRPGAEGMMRKEGDEYIKINSAGLRDREHALVKPNNSFRIAILGDSYAEAMQVPLEDTFWTVLETELNACPALGRRRPEVINFGVSGYGTAQELIALRHRAWSYQPDAVILAFLTGNDVRNNSRDLEKDNFRPYFRYENSHLVADTTFQDSAGFRLRQSWPARWVYRVRASSRVLQVVGEAMALMTALAARVELPKLEGGPANAAEGVGDNAVATRWDGFGEAGLDAEVYREPQEPAWKEAWDITEGLVAAMHEEVAAKGAKFLVVTLSNSPQVHPDPDARAAFAKRLGVSDLFYPDERVRMLGRQKGFDVLTLAPGMRAYAEEHHVFLHGFQKTGIGTGHWNKDGHHLAGQRIAQKMCSDFQARAV